MEDYQFDFFAFDQIQEFFGAGAQLLLVVVSGPGFANGGERALHDGSVDGQENGSGLWETKQDGLVAGSMAGSFEEGEAGSELGVAVDQAIVESGMIPV